jgi:CRISPR-associated endonuclease/helicase Cas3
VLISPDFADRSQLLYNLVLNFPLLRYLAESSFHRRTIGKINTQNKRLNYTFFRYQRKIDLIDNKTTQKIVMTKPEFAAHTPQSPTGEWHSLKEHLYAVASDTEEKANKLQAGRLGYYAGLWHDLGKYNPKFQDFLQKAHIANLNKTKFTAKKVPHAIYGAFLSNDFNCTPTAKLTLEFIIAGHHSGLANKNDLKSAVNDPLKRSDFAVVKSKAETELGELKPKEILDSYPKSFRGERIAEELFIRLLFSCLIDADRLDTELFANPEQYRLRQERVNAITIDRLWQVFTARQEEFIQGSIAAELPVNSVRSAVYEKCLEAATETPGVFRLCVPTGGGKTRSGLGFALKHAQKWGKDRVIFAVPYTSIIEQTVRVYRENIFEELGEAAVLEHHSAVQDDRFQKYNLEDDLESDENILTERQQAKLATQNWDAKLIVTTTVQLLESLFSHKPRKCRKLHNIVNSVIVLDEVQTLPIGLLSPILSVLKELVDRYNVTVVLCTATQPALSGSTPYFKDGFPIDSVRDIIEPELAKEHFRTLQRVKYEVPQSQETWTWADLVADMESSLSSLVVLNTRRDAIALLNALDVPNGYNTESIEPRVMATLQESEVLHLSTLLCGKHRQMVLMEVRRRLEAKEPCRLISTQVVEAGVDLDFPVVYRAMGPLDRIVQAAGRCNRNGTLAMGRVVIFEPAEGSKPPSGEYTKAIQRTRDLLQSADFEELQLHEPDIFDRYFQSLYPTVANDRGELDKKGIQKSRHSWHFRDVGERFKLIEEGTTPIVILYDDAVRSRLDEIARRGISREDWDFLQPYTISLPIRLFDKLTDKRQVKDGLDLWQWMGNYDSIRGFPLDEADRDVVIDPMFLMA